jgi:hypothetical protein
VPVNKAEAFQTALQAAGVQRLEDMSRPGPQRDSIRRQAEKRPQIVTDISEFVSPVGR